MRKFLILTALLLLAGCRGGGEDASILQASPAELELPRGLGFSWVAESDSIEITLAASQLSDVYQAAASVIFPLNRYEVTEISPGGGLGSPAGTYFAGRMTADGRIDFGYTKRFAGPGETGDVELLKFRVVNTDDFSIEDFRINYEAAPVIRDSRKQVIELIPDGGVH